MNRVIATPKDPALRISWMRRIAGRLAIVFVSIATLPASAQDFPNRPLRLIVTTAPGGIADTIFRTAAEPMAKALGQPVVVDSKPGGSGAIGSLALAKSPPDGHVLGMTSDTTLVILPLLRRNLPYSPEKDLVPLAPVAVIPFGLIVPASLPVSNVKEFVEYARSHPGKLNYASIGAGSSYHLAAEMFMAQEKLDLVHVPYQGGSQMLTSLIRNDTSAAFAGVATFVEQVKAGTLKILAVSGERRISALPDVPTFKEAGFPEYRASADVGVAVPKGTPAAVQRRLLDAIYAALDDPTYRRIVVAHGMVVPDRISQTAYVDDLDAERKRWSALISQRHIPIE